MKHLVFALMLVGLLGCNQPPSKISVDVNPSERGPNKTTIVNVERPAERTPVVIIEKPAEPAPVVIIEKSPQPATPLISVNIEKSPPPPPERRREPDGPRR